jgi:hypothetical protein
MHSLLARRGGIAAAARGEAHGELDPAPVAARIVVIDHK